MEQLTIEHFGTDLGEIGFQVFNCSLVSAGLDAEYWSCDFAVSRDAALIGEFRRITLIEKPGQLAFIAGIEHESGLATGLFPKEAARNRKLIQFLRKESMQDAAFRRTGPYHAERTAMVAYMLNRGLHHPFGIGFFAAPGKYELLSVEHP